MIFRILPWSTATSQVLLVYLLTAALLTMSAVGHPAGTISASEPPSPQSATPALEPSTTDSSRTIKLEDTYKLMIGRQWRGKWVKRWERHHPDHIYVFLVGDDAFALEPSAKSTPSTEAVTKLLRIPRSSIGNKKYINTDYITFLNAYAHFYTIGIRDTALHNLKDIRTLKFLYKRTVFRDSFDYVDCALAYIKSYHVSWDRQPILDNTWTAYKANREKDLKVAELQKVQKTGSDTSQAQAASQVQSDKPLVTFARQDSKGKWLSHRFRYRNDDIFVLIIGENDVFAFVPSGASGPVPAGESQSSSSSIMQALTETHPVLPTSSSTFSFELGRARFARGQKAEVFGILRDIRKLQEQVGRTFLSSFDYVDGAMEFLLKGKYVTAYAAWQERWNDIKAKRGREEIGLTEDNAGVKTNKRKGSPDSTPRNAKNLKPN
ncbi:hypothetical protein F5050DRAFT_1753008 [Lentinula boryana]|uniref:Uncharacterized protein n=1 Tax=Lentinula boryana TaxID=40481 RepID=A0ABQ8QFI4_9AGAR|nr:hypothetical protein F5050DRAFT_1753008 [Lentinula boryana]